MTTHQFLDIINRVSLPEGQQLVVHPNHHHGWLLQIAACTGDSENPSIKAWQKGRKWYISPHATPNEVIRTIHFAGIAFITHEFNEQFKFDGKQIANPHLNVVEMATIGTEHR